MIPDAIIGLVTAMLIPIITFGPDGGQITGFMESIHNAGSQIGQQMGYYNSVIPATEAATLAWMIATFLVPALLAYKVANWIYRHIPSIAGFGPGSG